KTVSWAWASVASDMAFSLFLVIRQAQQIPLHWRQRLAHGLRRQRIATCMGGRQLHQLLSCRGIAQRQQAPAQVYRAAQRKPVAGVGQKRIRQGRTAQYDQS